MYCESALKAASHTQRCASCLSSCSKVKSDVFHMRAVWSAEVVTSKLQKEMPLKFAFYFVCRSSQVLCVGQDIRHWSTDSSCASPPPVQTNLRIIHEIKPKHYLPQILSNLSPYFITFRDCVNHGERDYEPMDTTVFLLHPTHKGHRINSSNISIYNFFTKTMNLLLNKPWETQTPYLIQSTVFYIPHSSSPTLHSVLCGSMTYLHHGTTPLGMHFLDFRFYIIFFISIIQSN